MIRSHVVIIIIL